MTIIELIEYLEIMNSMYWNLEVKINTESWFRLVKKKNIDLFAYSEDEKFLKLN